MTLGRINTENNDIFVNMDKTIIYFDNSLITLCVITVKTVSVRRSCKANKRCAVCIAAAADSIWNVCLYSTDNLEGESCHSRVEGENLGAGR